MHCFWELLKVQYTAKENSIWYLHTDRCQDLLRISVRTRAAFQCVSAEFCSLSRLVDLERSNTQ